MARPVLIFPILLLLLLFPILLLLSLALFRVSVGKVNQRQYCPPSSCGNQQQHCPPSSCGNIPNITYPFWLDPNPNNCTGLQGYNLSCENNLTVLSLGSAKFYVQAIYYDNLTIRVVDPGIQKGSCSSIPHYSLDESNYGWNLYLDFRYGFHEGYREISKEILFLSCGNPVNATDLYVDASACVNASSFSTSYLPQSKGGKRYYYVKIDKTRSLELKSSCRIELISLVPFSREKNYSKLSYLDVHRQLEYGFELTWDTGFAYRPWLNGIWLYGIELLGVAILWRVAVSVIGIPCFIIFLVYKWRRRHLSMYDLIEKFLQSNNNLMPVRYSYSNIKKMTNGFKDKLGEGGFGEVYKAKLKSGRLAAVKLLGKSNATGQDFVSEVATIGRIHHVNVVQLIGFCVEGSKRALVYDFMPNRSLDKHIFPREENASLGWESLYKIALGVARGIEYLHQGCDMQILHFDIKPHNILLDENFIPKISDFGLAKLYSTGNTIVSLTAARGTLGYMAPELFYKNIGGVSYKADVYSYGMLLMEIASKRKNLDPHVEHSSQIFFPSWVSKQMNKGMELEISEIAEDQKKMVKKQIMVALWFTQMRPTDRPSMHKVVEMLEADLESLQMPPTPFQFHPQEIQEDDSTKASNLTESSSSSCNDTEIESI